MKNYSQLIDNQWFNGNPVGTLPITPTNYNFVEQQQNYVNPNSANYPFNNVRGQSVNELINPLMELDNRRSTPYKLPPRPTKVEMQTTDPFGELPTKSFELPNPSTYQLPPISLNQNISKEKPNRLGNLLDKANKGLGEMKDPSIFDVASMVNIARAAGNYMQPKPPMIRLNRVDTKQNKLNEQPYEQMSDAIGAQNSSIMETIKRGSSTASSLLAGGNNVAVNNIKGQNQAAMDYANVAQNVMAQNIAQSNQANAANTEIGNQEILQNLQMQMQHAQMKRESVNNNVNAAMTAQAQELQYNNQKEFADKTEKIQARNLEFQQKYRDYWMKRNDPAFEQKLHDERSKVMDAYNKEFGFDSDNYKVKKAAISEEVKTKGLENYSSYFDITTYKKELETAGTDEAKKQTVIDKYANIVIEQQSSEYVRSGLSDYMGKNYKLEDIVKRELGDTPVLDFTDILTPTTKK